MIDRVQLVSWAPPGQKPPQLAGFLVVRDSFVRCQTTTSTYSRCRQYASLTDEKQIFWQYARQKGWLKPWKINIVADDQKGLSYDDVGLVLSHCRHYRFLVVELAVDFAPCIGVDEGFVRKHAVFGKSRREYK